jgi:hypothetical protein
LKRNEISLHIYKKKNNKWFFDLKTIKIKIKKIKIKIWIKVLLVSDENEHIIKKNKKFNFKCGVYSVVEYIYCAISAILK